MDLSGISLTETDGQVFLRHQPVAGRAPVDVAALHALLAQEGYAPLHAGNCVALDI